MGDKPVISRQRKKAGDVTPSFSAALRARDEALVVFLTQKLEAAGVMLGDAGIEAAYDATASFNRSKTGKQHAASVSAAATVAACTKKGQAPCAK